VLLMLENRFVFHPTRDVEPPPPGLHIQDVELRSADGTPIHAWWTISDDWQPAQGALLYCHGNGGNLTYRGESVRRLRDLLRLGVLIFDYPGYGRSGGMPTESGCYAAADAAYDWLTGVQKIPGERVMLYGGSLGCAVATDLAVRQPHRALVLVSPFSSLPDMAQLQFPWLPARYLVRNRFDNLSKIISCRRPVFIAHGTADRIVPFAQGERLFAVANEPKRFFPMPGYDHNHTPGHDFYETLRDFLAGCERTAD
jgi:fermentation-respiration switch protein FrsA (DUF1100 family)